MICYVITGNTKPYGKQHPSYVQQELNTRVGVGDTSTMKKLEVSNDVVYGKVSEMEENCWFYVKTEFSRKVSETPTTPIKAIEEVDERLIEKLSLLEKTGNKNMEDVVSDLWSIMEQNGG